MMSVSSVDELIITIDPQWPDGANFDDLLALARSHLSSDAATHTRAATMQALRCITNRNVLPILFRSAPVRWCDPRSLPFLVLLGTHWKGGQLYRALVKKRELIVCGVYLHPFRPLAPYTDDEGREMTTKLKAQTKGATKAI